MKKFFLTFGDERLARSKKRIFQQAKELNFFDEILIYGEQDIDAKFRSLYADKLLPQVRGYGYWCWKPQIIKQALVKMSAGDVLLYTDVGCHLNVKGLDRLRDYFSIASNSDTGILAFQGVPPEESLKYDGRPLPDLTEKLWTKGDVFDYFDVRYRSEITDTQTCGAGVVVVKKCQRSTLLIDKWLQAISSSFALIDDTPSVSSNAAGFVEHRHDQTLFSILCKLFEVERLSAYEYSYPSWRGGEDWELLATMPIHAKRDLDFGFCGNAKRFAKNKIHGIKKRLHVK